MPRYLVQASYTAAAAAAFVSNPEDRVQAIRGLFEKLGGTLHSIDFCFGDYDVVGVVSMPDASAAAAAALAASAAGHLSDYKTTCLMTPDEFLKAQQQAKGATIAPPKG